MSKLQMLVFSVIAIVFIDITLAKVHVFEKNQLNQKRSVSTEASEFMRALYKRAVDDQNTCFDLADYNDKLKANNNVHVFHNDSNPSIALTWSGKNGVIIALTTMNNGFITHTSRLYRSDNRGKVFHDISSKIGPAYIRKTNGIQVNPVDSSHIMLLSYNSPYDPTTTNTILHITRDAAETFDQATCPFSIDDTTIKFNPNNKYRILASALNHDLWFSKDFGTSWNKIATFVITAKWDPSNEDIFYFTMDPLHTLTSFSLENELYRYDIPKSQATVLAQHVHSFAVQENFIFLSTQFSGKNGSRVMHVSKDMGDTWSAAQLPLINKDQFYSLLDMSEQMVFVHVDLQGDTGHGSIYTSDERGVIYSLSLERHLYPNNEGVTDFYKVKSLDGVYITTQLSQDNTVHSLITFDKGGTWQPITKPEGVSCKDTEKYCKLQIHNYFSKAKGVGLPSLPLSSKSATGLVLAHGNVGDGLSFNSPNVYVSRDGGYKWTSPKDLVGPHFYGIGDSGGILFAIPAKAEPLNTIFFSLDEGACWKSYQFFEKKIRVTGVSAEPGEKATDVSIWGWDSEGDGSWMTITFDFQAVLGQECTNSDYVTWLAHESNSVASLAGGCLLGAKRTFIRRKKGSICMNGGQLNPTPISVPCECQTTDFLCDYGYKRDSTGKCEQDESFATSKQDICVSDKEEEITTQGYRKIAGDLCAGGFDPPRTLTNLHKSCAIVEEEKEDYGVVRNKFKTYPTKPSSGSSHTGLIALLVLCVLGLSGTVLYILYKRRFSMLKVRYTPLSSDDSPVREKQSLIGSTSLVDNDEAGLYDSNGGTTTGSGALISYHDDSDEDLLVT